MQRDTATSQIPVRLRDDADIAHGDGTLFQIRDVRLYRAAVQFEFTASVEPATVEQLQLPLDRPIDLAGWLDERPQDVVVSVAADGELLPVVPMQGQWPPRQGHRSVLTIDTKGHIDAGGAWTSVTYWVPFVPTRVLVFTAQSTALGLSGVLDMDATGWTERLAEVRDRR